MMKNGNGEGWGFLIYPHMNIKIYHECEGGIEKYILRITFDHLLASRCLLSDDKRDCEGQIFRPHPHTNNGFFFLLTIKFSIKKNSQKFSITLKYGIT